MTPCWNRQLKSSLEAEVDIIIPNDLENSLVDLLRREGTQFRDFMAFHPTDSPQEHFLKTLLIVSDASLVDEGSLGVSSSEWVYSDSVSIQGAFFLPSQDTCLKLFLYTGFEEAIAIRVRPAAREKCPRCWTFTRESDDRVCDRCEKVINLDHSHS